MQSALNVTVSVVMVVAAEQVLPVVGSPPQEPLGAWSRMGHLDEAPRRA
jgi:hypothetical protein